MKKAVIYARYSSYNQKDESIEQQIAVCTEFIKANNLKLVGVFQDEHKTGRSDKRSQFQKMIKEAEKGSFNVIVAYKSSRISRNMLHALEYEMRLEKFGVSIMYAKEEFGNSAAGRFALRSMMNLNQFYSENLSEDVIRAMTANAEQCRSNGSLPYGYKSDDNGRIIIDEERAKTVRLIYKRIAEGGSFAELNSELKTLHVKTKTGKDFSYTSYDSIIPNERYKGIYIFRDFRKEGGMPRIIDDITYNRAVVRLKNKKELKRKSMKSDFLLTGKLFCGCCESKLIGVSGHNRVGNKYDYYACSSKLKHKCELGYIPKLEIENRVCAVIREQLLTDENIEAIATGTMNVAKNLKNDDLITAIREELRANKRAIENMLKALEQGIITESTKKRLTELEENRVMLENDLKVELAKDFNLSKDKIIFWLESFRNGNFENKAFRRKLFDSFIYKIYVYSDKLTIFFDASGKSEAIEVEAVQELKTLAESVPDVLLSSDHRHQSH